MAAAYATIRLLGRSGRVYAINAYASDAANVALKFDESKVAVAGSSDTYTVKEPASLVDVCFTTDLATPTNIQVQRNGTPTGDILDVTAHLTTVNARPNPVIPFNAGDKLGLMQIS